LLEVLASFVAFGVFFGGFHRRHYMRLSVALLLLLTCCTLAWSQAPPIQRSEKPTERNDKQNTTKPSGNAPGKLGPAQVVDAHNSQNAKSQTNDGGSGEQKQSGEGWIIGCTIVLTLCAALQFGAMVFQYREMRKQAKLMEGQLAEMRSSGAQTKDLLQHASNQVVALFSAATAAGIQAEAMKEVATASINSATAAKDSAKALMAGERAWLLVAEVSANPQEDIVNSGRPYFTYLVHNFGKTPALMIAQRSELLLGDINTPGGWQGEDEEFKPFRFLGSWVNNAVIAPSDKPFPINSAVWKGVEFTPEERESLWENSRFLWACGCVWYHDVFGDVQHKTRFAYIYNVIDKRFVRAEFPGLNEVS
jgi:hypothetical protein